MADDSLVVGFCSLQQTRLLSYGQPYPRVRVQYLALNSHQPLTIFLEIIIVLLPFTDSTVQLIVASISLVNHTVIKIKSREFLSPGRPGGGGRGGAAKRERGRERENTTSKLPRSEYTQGSQKIMLNININITLSSLKLKS